ncbi:MAG: TolC family protein [Planctomycetota bacterium]
MSPAVFVALAACSAASYVADADDEVSHTLRHATEQVLGDRENWVMQPALAEPAPPAVSPAVRPEVPPAGPPAVTPEVSPAVPLAVPPATTPAELAPGETPTEPAPAATKPPEALDLKATLALAVRQNREFLSRRESLYREGLSISLTRFQFGPQFAAAVTYLWPRSEGGFESHRAGTNLSGSQILPTGGSLGVSAALDADWPFDRGGTNDPSFGTNVGVSLRQPLLRGAGYAISHESLTQAERQLTYAIRDFELFRLGFTINITQRFFELSSSRKTLDNEAKNLDRAAFDRRQAEALLQVGRKAELEVFLARRREIEAKDQLINATAAYDRSIDDFKILLGLSTKVPIELSAAEPEYKPVRFDVSSAIAAALHNRLDLITVRQGLEDTERALRIAENNLLPDLQLTASYGLAGTANDIDRANPDQWSSSVGLSFEIPLQRKSQRNAYRSSLISLEQARRSLQQREDQLELEIRNSMRQLHSLEERIVLQEDQIKQETRAARVTRIRFEGGAGSNRDLLEAEQALVNAENALIRLKVDHFVARLNLLKDMGVFFVDDNGMWR